MAAFETSQPLDPTRGLVLFAHLNRLQSAVADAWARYKTRDALSQLTDRELDDIGLTRGDIKNVSL